MARIRELPFVPAPATVAQAIAGSVNFNSTAKAGTRRRGELRYAAPQKSPALVLLQKELHAFARAHLTTTAVARHVVGQSLGAEAAGAMFHSHRGGPRHGRGDAEALAKAGATAHGAIRASLRVLLIAAVDGGFGVQIGTIHDGLRALGAEVEVLAADGAKGERPHGRHDAHGGGAVAGGPRRAHGRNKPVAGRQGVSTLSLDDVVGSQSRAPYSLIVVELGTDGVDEELSKVVASLLPRAHASNTRVACVRSDSQPPPVWRLWVPKFCNVAFVREMRAGW